MATPQRIKYHGQTYVRLKTAASAEQAAQLAQKTAATVGPRGGKIIGKTKSGKPIYEPSEKLHKVFTKDEIAGDPWGTVDHLGPPGTTRQVLAQHPDYTLQDHHDAAVLHEQAASALLDGTDPYNRAHRAQRAKAHAHALLSRIHYYAAQQRAPRR